MTRVEVLADGVTLYLGDCLEVLPTIGNHDAGITDPPFGVGNFVQQTGNIRGARVDWNDAPVPPEFFSIFRTKTKQRIIWGANFFNCFEARGGAVVWVKNQPMPDFSKCDIASSSYRQKTELVTITWTNFVNTKETAHPCERPVDLYRWCIDYLPNPSSVLDPFMGSGSVGVAAVRMARAFTGVERHPPYFEMACRRIEAALKQPDMFIEPPKPIKQEAFL